VQSGYSPMTGVFIVPLALLPEAMAD